MDKSNHSFPKAQEAELSMLRTDLNRSLRMLRDLIRLHLQESELKKHHKAYLHVRDRMDELCRENWKAADEIVAHYLAPAKSTRNKVPEGMVLMSSESLGVMQDDMRVLTEGIDLMAKLVRSLMSGQRMRRGELESAVSMAEEVLEDVSRRWEDVELSDVM